MTAATKPQSFVKLYCFCVVSSLLATVSSATADVGRWWSACAPIDGRCPPGFLLSDNGNSCVCGSEDDALPIDRCDKRHCRAYLRSGYWAGYVKGDYGTNGSRLELYTGRCPRGFCKSVQNGAPLLLPGHSNSSNPTEELNRVVCGVTRKGFLCGECSPGFGPGVNLLLAPCVHCATDPLSQVGWLLWLLLEALPMLLMLAAFLVFDINLLAGPLNSYLLYAQFISASWPISTVGPIKLDNSAGSVVTRFAFVIFFGIFNLQFFLFLFPPFCISPDAANLDQLDLVLITALIRLVPFIIILAIIALQWCNQYGYCRVMECWQRILHRSKTARWLTKQLSGQSAVHGLSAFFILVYTSFLSYGGVLCGRTVIEPSSVSNASAVAVFDIQGSLDFFQVSKHVVITIFILLLCIFMILLPTFLLLVYPALPQLQAKFQCSKHKVLRCVSGLKCLNIFSRPIIQHFGDLFQSSYKDNCRFFAGVLLLVRIGVVIAGNVSSSREEGYAIMTALSLAVLTLHSLLRPNQNRWINVIDSLMYAHLVAVNLLAVYIYSLPNNLRSSQESWFTLYQFVLFAPSAYLVLYVARVLRRRWGLCRRRPSARIPPSVEAADNGAYIPIEHVVEVDPQVEENPVREKEHEVAVERSYGSVAKRNNRHQELWFSDT